MNPIDVLTVLLSVLGVVAVTELAMWLYLMIHRTERNPFTFRRPKHADRTLPVRLAARILLAASTEDEPRRSRADTP
jgi:hypothetical protein